MQVIINFNIRPIY